FRPPSGITVRRTGLRRGFGGQEAGHAYESRRSQPGMMVSALVSRFADVHRENPARPLVYAPGVGITLTASDIWVLHRRYADRLASLGLDSDQLIISAVGNHTDSMSLLLACRAIGVAVMPIDAGTTLSEILDITTRFGAAALV